jgi:hypothetical protein
LLKTIGALDDNEELTHLGIFGYYFALNSTNFCLHNQTLLFYF